MSTTLTKPTTADELCAMPDDGFRYELVKGELIRMSAAADKHGRVTMNLAGPLQHHVLANKLGVVYAAETGNDVVKGFLLPVADVFQSR